MWIILQLQQMILIAVNEDATVTQSTGSGLLVADDTDADGRYFNSHSNSSNRGINSSDCKSTYNSGSPETLTGTYGNLTVGADGTYTYVADQSAADDLDAWDMLQIVLLIQFQMEQLPILQH